MRLDVEDLLFLELSHQPWSHVLNKTEIGRRRPQMVYILRVGTVLLTGLEVGLLGNRSIKVQRLVQVITTVGGVSARGQSYAASQPHLNKEIAGDKRLHSVALRSLRDDVREDVLWLERVQWRRQIRGGNDRLRAFGINSLAIHSPESSQIPRQK